MILKRISEAIRSRDWVAVAIEFVIVVMGIFVALQVDNWNEARRDLQLEQVYISRLVDDMRANLELLEQHEQIFEDKVQFILALPDLSLTAAIEPDPDAFVFQLDNSSYKAIPDLRSDTYEELESSGRLSLIRDVNLRTAVANTLNDYRSVRPVLAEQIGDYRRILFETLPGRIYYAHRVGSGAVDASAIAASIERLRNDPRFEAAANAEVTYGSDTLFFVRDFKRRTEEILSLLEASQ